MWCVHVCFQLENEVASLKRRLDELRKAKNTTILKREREILEVGTPFGRRYVYCKTKVGPIMEKYPHVDVSMCVCVRACMHACML